MLEQNEIDSHFFVEKMIIDLKTVAGLYETTRDVIRLDFIFGQEQVDLIKNPSDKVFSMVRTQIESGSKTVTSYPLEQAHALFVRRKNDCTFKDFKTKNFYSEEDLMTVSERRKLMFEREQKERDRLETIYGRKNLEFNFGGWLDDCSMID